MDQPYGGHVEYGPPEAYPESDSYVPTSEAGKWISSDYPQYPPAYEPSGYPPAYPQEPPPPPPPHVPEYITITETEGHEVVTKTCIVSDGTTITITDDTVTHIQTVPGHAVTVTETIDEIVTSHLTETVRNPC